MKWTGLKNHPVPGRKKAAAALSRKIPGIVWVALVTALFGVLSFSGSFSTAKDVERDASLDGYAAYMDERVPALMRQYGIPGVSLALVQEGSEAWTRAYGFADVKAGRRMTVDTPMRVQSISKPVAAWGVMKLVEQGRLDLDRPVVQYINSWSFPHSSFPVEKITVRQLLCHTSGMPLGDVFDMYAPTESAPSLKESLTRSAVLIRQPGSGFSYSNVGYNLLELLVEEVTGRDFAEYMRDEILLPLGMRHSTFLWSETASPRVPDGYALSGAAVPVYIYPEKASGGLFATAEDIAAFVVAGMPAFSGNPVLNRQSVENLYVPQAEHLGVYSLVFDSYGKGYYLEQLPDGKPAVAHGGQGTGLMTHFHAVPGSGDAIVILTNSQRSWPFIAHILKDWSRWRGFSPIGMERILWGQSGLWALVGLVSSAVLLQLARLGAGVSEGKRKFTLSPGRMALPQFVQCGASFLLLAGLVWCLCQRYLFLSSVFPIAAVWLGAAAGALSVVLLASALLMKKV